LHLWSLFDLKIIKNNPGFISFEIEGRKSKIFLKESGGHRWQRVPPTEKCGRVHTSSVTVAVLESKNDLDDINIDQKDLKIRSYKASGKGGQHRNKVESAIEIVHLPSGIKAKCDSERSQYRNRQIAFESLKRKLYNDKLNKENYKLSELRLSQIGSGLRGDKVQTVQEQNGKVVNHINKKQISFKKYMKGRFDLLH